MLINRILTNLPKLWHPIILLMKSKSDVMLVEFEIFLSLELNGGMYIQIVLDKH